MELKGKTVWITGASGGIGKELAVQMAEKGARIILSSRNEIKLEALREELAGEDHLLFPMDLLDVEMIAPAVEVLLPRVGNIDILVNNAGITQRALAKDTLLEVDREIMELDYFAVVALTKAVLPSMLERKAGMIVTVGSVAGKFGVPMRTAYCGAKHAIIGFMDALRTELHGEGIQVLLANPGSVRTQISVNALEGDGSKHNVVDPLIANGMPAEVCARKIIRGIKKERRELIIATGKTRLAVFLRKFWPGLLFRMITRSQTT